LIIKNCTVLLVEDDPNDVILINRAFNKAKPVNPLQVVGDGEQAIDYLAGQGSFSDRDLHPLPALILMGYKAAAQVWTGGAGVAAAAAGG